LCSFQKEITPPIAGPSQLTGWAQINYGYVSNVTETAVKLEYDLFYIKHRTLMMDIRIVLRTIGTVFGFRGR
jgi:lipopolysaccharide/colanic/teichoic acid biosynthesis glycosyltransferase